MGFIKYVRITCHTQGKVQITFELDTHCNECAKLVLPHLTHGWKSNREL